MLEMKYWSSEIVGECSKVNCHIGGCVEEVQVLGVNVRAFAVILA